jgi:hypothetical integral membrane protein (TIGR02206 family)
MFAAIIVAHELGNVALHLFVFEFAWRESLPLNFCRANMWLVAWMLARRSYRAFEVAYFWAVVGAGVALLAPDLQEGFPHPLFFTFFVGHGLGVFAVVYAVRGFGFTPGLASLARALLAAVALAAVAISVNAWLDTNYLYLARRPAGSAILDVFEPWPGYLAGVFSVGLLACVLAWLPFARGASVRESRETLTKR